MEGVKEIISSMRVLLAVALLVTLALLKVTGLAAEIDQERFVPSMVRLRLATGMAPKLPREVRLVMQEDRSLEALGTPLNFKEWYAIGTSLLARGFERVVLLGVHDTDEALPREHDDGVLAAGVAVVPSRANLRATAAGAMPPGSFLATPSNPAVPEGAVIGPVRSGVIDRFGTINARSQLRIPTYVQVGAASALPQLGLLAARELRYENERVVVTPLAGAPVTLPQDIYLDYLEPSSVAAASLPVRAIIDQASRAPFATLGPNATAKLADGRVAILVPDAHTGSRFVDSPIGLLLGHHAILGVLAGAVTGDFVTDAPFAAALPWLFAVALWLAATRRAPRRAYAAIGAVTAVWVLAAAGAYLRYRLVIPCYSGLTLAFVALSGRGIAHFLVVFGDKVRLVEELTLGNAVQQLLLPESLQGRAGAWEFSLHYRPFGALAGDWLQVHVDESRGRLVVALGDVVGKGAGAALATTIAASVFRASALDWSNGELAVEAFVERLDEAMRLAFRGTQFTTLSLIAIDGDVAKIARFGAPSWILRDGEGEAFKSFRGPNADPLGFGRTRPNATRNPWTVLPTKPGAEFLAFTDGLLDGSSAVIAGVKALNATASFTGCAARFELLERTGDGKRLPDDMTLFVVRRRTADETTGDVAA